MLSIAAIVAISAMLFLFDFPRLRRDGQKRELWTFSLLLLFGTALGIVQSLNLPLPNPMEWIVAVFKPVSAWLYAEQP
ncbi:hypothetical protein [Paenibacillus sp. PAMC21692]|uniref:hypothetical protein n=1 Tax=Paenibacillus sp. PAMC21692 TaxID=2762320 RepID=UPI00164DFA59|nr:hypothetical protein [Paenibacillus sp. PAMC21692]QNK57306.1 hypothetical protein H7F31_33355 [Paenibacillus sp. PAMC21692]